MAADDRLILAPRQNRLDEAELAEAPLQGVEFILRDPTRVGGIGTQLVERDLRDAKGSGGCLVQ